jgi:hypothetical protein
MQHSLQAREQLALGGRVLDDRLDHVGGLGQAGVIGGDLDGVGVEQGLRGERGGLRARAHDDRAVACGDGRQPAGDRAGPDDPETLGEGVLSMD